MRAFAGRWKITKTDLWCDEDLGLLGSPEIVFRKQGMGSIRVGALEAELDYRADKSARVPCVRFSWSGFDDLDPTSGRGWAEIHDDLIRGRLFIHMGDEIEFMAVRNDEHQNVSTRHG